MDKAASLIQSGRISKAHYILKRIRSFHLPLNARADYFQMVGSLLQSRGHYQGSFHDLKKALHYFRSTRDYAGVVEICHQLGDIFRQLERYDIAKRWYKNSAGAVSRMNSDRKIKNQWRLDASTGEALCWRGLEKYARSLRLLKTNLSTYEKNRDLQGSAYLMWAVGTTLRFMGRLKEADKNLQSAVRLYKKLGDKSGYAYALCGLGGTLRMRGLYKKSQSCYRSAQTQFKKDGDEFGLAYSSCGQANALRMQGRFKEARRHFKRAFSIYRRKNLMGPLGFVLWSLAQQDIQLLNIDKANRHLREAGKLFKSVKDKRGLVYVQLGWGMYHKRSNTTKAYACFKKAYKKAKRLDLKLEMTHAARLLGIKNAETMYRSLGVIQPGSAFRQMLP